MTEAKPLTMTNLRAMLPEIEAADAAFHASLQATRNNDDLQRITDTYNAILARAAEAIYLDTADRNSRDTIVQVFRPRGTYDTWFGHSPLTAVRDWAAAAQDHADPDVVVKG